MILPTKRECSYILEMLESRLIDSSYVNPWAEQLIEQTDIPPVWLCDLAMKIYQGDLTGALRTYVFSEPFEEMPPDTEKFHVACLWLRYERREISWATFLELAGRHLDCVNGDWFCETPYHYLNVYEDSYFSLASEEDTKRQYLRDQPLLPFVEHAKLVFEPFRRLMRSNRATSDRYAT